MRAVLLRWHESVVGTTLTLPRWLANGSYILSGKSGHLGDPRRAHGTRAWGAQ
jgi:hypothetical protein